MFERNRSNMVELPARAYDHAKHTYKFGFRILTLGWSDGSTFRQLVFITEYSSCCKKIGYDVIGMVKKTPKMFFRYNGEDISLITIYNKNKKRRGRSKYLLSVMVEVVKKNSDSRCRGKGIAGTTLLRKAFLDI